MGKKKDCILLTPKINDASNISQVRLTTSLITTDWSKGKEATYYWNNKFPNHRDNDIVNRLLNSDNLQWSYVPFLKDKFPNLRMIFPLYKSWEPMTIGLFRNIHLPNGTATFICKGNMVCGKCLLFDTEKNMSVDYFRKIKEACKVDPNNKELRKYSSKGGLKKEYISVTNKDGTLQKYPVNTDEFKILSKEAKTKEERKKIKDEYLEFFKGAYVFPIEELNLLNCQMEEIYVNQGRRFYQATDCFNFDERGAPYVIEMNSGKENKEAEYFFKEPKLIKSKDYDKLVKERKKIDKNYEPEMMTKESEDRLNDKAKKNSKKIKAIREKLAKKKKK